MTNFLGTWHEEILKARQGGTTATSLVESKKEELPEGEKEYDGKRGSKEKEGNRLTVDM